MNFRTTWAYNSLTIMSTTNYPKRWYEKCLVELDIFAVYSVLPMLKSYRFASVVDNLRSYHHLFFALIHQCFKNSAGHILEQLNL